MLDGVTGSMRKPRQNTYGSSLKSCFTPAPTIYGQMLRRLDLKQKKREGLLMRN